jgi:hypothetical protein
MKKNLAAAEPTARRRKIRNTAEWFERTKLAAAAARERALALAQEYGAPSMKGRPSMSQQRRLAERLRAKSVVCG